jgi:hypothetical protein
LAVENLDTFFDRAAHLIGRMQSAHPVLFDRVEGWVVWQAAAWWREARRGTYHIPRPDGTIFVKGGGKRPDVVARPMRLDHLPCLELHERSFYARLAPSRLTELLADEGPGANAPTGDSCPSHVPGCCEEDCLPEAPVRTLGISLAFPTADDSLNQAPVVKL